MAATADAGRGRCRAAAVLALALAPAATAHELAGCWSGEASVQGEAGRFAISLEAGDDALRMRLHLDALDVHGLALGEARVDAGSVGLDRPGWRFRREAGALAGTIPPELVAGARIPIRLHRTTGCGPGESRAPDWPLRQPDRSLELGAPVRADLAVLGTDLLAADAAGCVHRVDAVSLRRRWSSCGAAAIDAAPTVHAGRVLVIDRSDTVAALDAADGRVHWRRALAAAGGRRPAEWFARHAVRSAASVQVHGQELFAYTLGGDWLRLDPRDGAELGRRPLGAAVVATPWLDEDMLLVATLDGRLRRFDPADGRERWSVSLDAPAATAPLLHRGHAWLGARDYRMHVVDAASGARVTSFYQWYSWMDAGAAAIGDDVVAGSSDARVVVRFQGDAGARRWRTALRGAAWMRPLPDGDAVIAGSVGVPGYFAPHAGGLVALDADDGSVRWHYPVANGDGPSGFQSRPVRIGAALLAADLQGRVHRFTDP